MNYKILLDLYKIHFFPAHYESEDRAQHTIH